MKFAPLTIEALGPLAFPERKPGVQFRHSLPYVPGAAIYGALGMLLGPEWADAQEFAKLFRNIRCHNAYPALEGDQWVRPLPMTAIEPKGGKPRRKCCTNPNEKQENFKHCTDTNDKNEELFRLPYDDLLYARVCWEQQQPAALIYAPTDSDGRPWEATGRTFYTLENAQHQPWQPGEHRIKRLSEAYLVTREVSQRVLTRVSINRRRGTAEDGRLYSPMVISETMPYNNGCETQLIPTRFRGSISVPDHDTEILRALADIVYVGGRQTSGIGAVAITAQQEARWDDARSQIKARIKNMTERFCQQAAIYQELGGSQWRDAHNHPQTTPGTIFTINLLADAILYEQGWLPTNEFSAEQLKEHTKIEARLLRSFTTTTTVGGWNVSWQRPKQTAIATSMGSVFVFQAANELTDEHYDALTRLEREGIGERRAEGYGQVRICDEFHLLQRSIAILRDL